MEERYSLALDQLDVLTMLSYVTRSRGRLAVNRRPPPHTAVEVAFPSDAGRPASYTLAMRMAHHACEAVVRGNRAGRGAALDVAAAGHSILQALCTGAFLQMHPNSALATNNPFSAALANTDATVTAKEGVDAVERATRDMRATDWVRAMFEGSVETPSPPDAGIGDAFFDAMLSVRGPAKSSDDSANTIGEHKVTGPPSWRHVFGALQQRYVGLDPSMRAVTTLLALLGRNDAAVVDARVAARLYLVAFFPLIHFRCLVCLRDRYSALGNEGRAARTDIAIAGFLTHALTLLHEAHKNMCGAVGIGRCVQSVADARDLFARRLMDMDARLVEKAVGIIEEGGTRYEITKSRKDAIVLATASKAFHESTLLSLSRTAAGERRHHREVIAWLALAVVASFAVPAMEMAVSRGLLGSWISSHRYVLAALYAFLVVAVAVMAFAIGPSAFFSHKRRQQ